jgi:adenosylhomocysteine nucleosidase
MEGAAVAQACELLGIPCIVIRSLSDLAGAESHLDFPRFLRAVSPAAAAVVARVVAVL